MRCSGRTASLKKWGTEAESCNASKLKLRADPTYRSTSSTRRETPFQPSPVVALGGDHDRVDEMLASGLVELVTKSGRDVPSGASRMS